MTSSEPPAISILLPFHREGAWLEQAAQSMLGQTFKNWELLLIGNRADRQTLEAAHRVVYLDNRVRLLFEDAPGIAHALNHGLRQATAPLIARMDADDVSLPERLERQVTYLNTHPEVDVVGTCTGAHPEGPPGEGFSTFMQWQNGLLSHHDHMRERFIESPVAHPTVLFRRTVIEKHGPYLTTGIPEDYELWLRWMEHGAVFAKLPETLVLWRDHSGRLTRTHPDYSKAGFSRIRSHYLALELKRIVGGRKLIVCGADRTCRRKAAMLMEMGVPVDGFADVVRRHIPESVFTPASEIGSDPGLFFLSFVSSRGKSAEMRDFFKSKGLEEGSDFILAH